MSDSAICGYIPQGRVLTGVESCVTMITVGGSYYTSSCSSCTDCYLKPFASHKSLKRLVKTAYSRLIASPSDLISRLTFYQVGADSAVTSTVNGNTAALRKANNSAFQAKFVSWVQEFLRQPGFTDNIAALYPDRSQCSPVEANVLRAKLLLRAATGFELLPVDNDRTAIKVGFPNNLNNQS